MAEVLLLNPRARRRKARRKNPSPAQKRARAAFAAAARARGANPARRRVRRSNPVVTMANPRRRRRRNPIVSYRRAAKRRSNPIINVNSIMTMIKDAAVQGAGAVAMDVGYSYVARYLPASMQAGPGMVNAGSAVKAILTAVAGRALSRATNGLSMKAATGALTVQARDIVAGLLPAGTMNGLSYAVPARVVNASNRIGPNRLGAYVQGQSPLLSAYLAPGSSPVLSGARARERAIR